MSESLVYGIGHNDKRYITHVNNIHIHEYNLWCSMLVRCTEKCKIKNPTYIGTTCSENFKSYSYFYEWCNKQIGFGNKEVSGKCRYWQLDKDLLVKGNKFYSEDTCVFVPHKINTLFTKRDNYRGDFPVGVVLCKNSGKYVARCSVGGVKQHIGRYDKPVDAFLAYKSFKESHIKLLANLYKDNLDKRAFDALINYEVEIGD